MKCPPQKPFASKLLYLRFPNWRNLLCLTPRLSQRAEALQVRGLQIWFLFVRLFLVCFLRLRGRDQRRLSGTSRPVELGGGEEEVGGVRIRIPLKIMARYY